MKKLLTALVALALVSTSLSSWAAPAVYKNCTAMNKVYSNGVAQSLKFKNLGKGPIATPKIDAKIYLANKKLDTDKDGIACEKVKSASDSSAQPTTPAGVGFAASTKTPGRLRMPRYSQPLQQGPRHRS